MRGGKREDEKAAEMYRLYQEGYTIPQIAKAFGGVSRETVYQMFKRRGLVMRSRNIAMPLLPDLKPVCDHPYERLRKGNENV